MRIGCDIDGVIADFNSAFIDLIRQQTSIVLPQPSATYPTTWNYDIEGGVAKFQADMLWEMIGAGGFWGQLHALPGAVDALQRLDRVRREHDIYFITSRPGVRAKWLTEQWLSWHGFSQATVLIVHDKGPVVNALELDIFIDDKPENIMAAWTVRNTRCYLVDRPYNKQVQESERITRVKSLNEVWDIELEPKLKQPGLTLSENLGLKAA